MNRTSRPDRFWLIRTAGGAVDLQGGNWTSVGGEEEEEEGEEMFFSIKKERPEGSLKKNFFRRDPDGQKNRGS